jgi:diaminobutyrate-2-oxoglutarate transaminase
VLKPSNLTRGEGVVIGAQTNSARWNDAIKAALLGHYIVQEYVPLPSIEVPRSDTVVLTPMRYGLDCYLFGGRLVGFQSRASVDPVINVGHGGWLLPVLHAERL